MAQNKSKAGRMKVVISTLLLFGPALFLIFIGTRGCEHHYKELDDYGKIANFQFTDAKNKIYTSKNFEGKVVLYTTIQPTCPNKCGISTWHLSQMIYKTLYENKKKLGYVRIVSVVTDENGKPSDNIADVQKYLERDVPNYDPNLWIIVKGDAKSLFNVKNNGESLQQSGKEYFGGQAFLETMLLTDKRMHVRMAMFGKKESNIRTMKEYIALLDKQYDKKDRKK